MRLCPRTKTLGRPCRRRIIYLFGHVVLAQVQVPESNDPGHAVARPHGSVGVVDAFLLLPDDDGHVERDAVHVDDDAEHAVEHAERERQLEQTVDAREQLHASAVNGPQVADVGGAERGYAEPRRSAGRGRHPAPPPRVLGLVHQPLDVLVQHPQSEVQGYAHQIEELLDHDARDVRQRRKQANQFCRAEREPNAHARLLLHVYYYVVVF